ncbi:White-opaque regulator 1 [Spathaspora sp. JA1]|nr:White-opaque regulator 1 [Spathaspora sp. JA1]
MSSAILYPSYYGHVGSTKDALLIIQEVLDKELDLVPRRPHERERSQLIKSGNVFVFIEEQSGIKRWTDGIAWSPSRLLGRFLVYRELDKQTLNEKDDRKKKKRKVSTDQSSSDFLNETTSKSSLGSLTSDTVTNTSSNTNSIPDSISYNTEYKRSLLGGPLVSSYAFKDQGLIKKTLSLTTTTKDLHIDKQDEKQTIHLISYYSADDVMNGKLQRPSEGDLKNTVINPNLWNAVKNSSLGGKIPIEDEAYYFLDNNYQLQNMSLFQKSNQNYPKIQSNSLQIDKYVNGQAPKSFQQQYMLPVPADGVKRERSQGATDMTFSNPFTGYNGQQPYSSSGQVSSGSNRNVVPVYNNYMLSQQSATPTQPISYNQSGQQMNQSQYAPLFQPPSSNMAPPLSGGTAGTQNHDIYSNFHYQPFLQSYPQAIPGHQYHYDQFSTSSNPATSNLFHSGAQTNGPSTSSNNGNNRKYSGNSNTSNNRNSTSSTASIGNNTNSRASLSQNFAFGNYNGNGYIASGTPLPLNNNGGLSSTTYDSSTIGTTTGGAVSGSSSYMPQYPLRRRSFSSSYQSGGMGNTLATVGGSTAEDSNGTGGTSSLYSANV